MVSPSRKRGPIPWGLLGAIVLAVGVESALARRDLELTRPDSFKWRWTQHQAKRRAPGCRTLAFGSSRMQNGFIPAVIEQRTGGAAFNLALIGARVPCCYYLLKQALDAGARPAAVLIDLYPGFLTRPVGSSPLGWTDVLRPGDALDMAWRIRSARFFGQVMLSKALPSLYYRIQVREVALSSLKGEPRNWRYQNLVYLRTYNQNKGSLLGAADQPYQGEIAPEQRRLLLGPAEPPDPVQVTYIHRFLDLAAAHGIRVYCVALPYSPPLQAGREERGLNADEDRLLRSLQSRPNVTVLDARYSGYGNSVFVDALHLDLEGAYALTLAIGDTIARPASPAWMRLASYRTPRRDVPVEDILMSHAALAPLRAETRKR